LKLFNLNSTFDVARDWGLDTDVDYPVSIACVPAQCTDPHDFSYRDTHQDLDLSKFDLVLISDIEMRTVSTIEDWVKRAGIRRYLVAAGSQHDHENLPKNYVYRPWWCYNFISLNDYQNVGDDKPFAFDVLLGARRPHRDYVMLAFQEAGLLDSSIVNYREFFQGAVIDGLTDRVHQQFSQVMPFPYTSPNIDHAWEVEDQLHRGISSIAPWEIYRRTRYSVVCETLGSGGCFFMSEKTTKAMLAKRVFVPVGSANFIAGLHKLGFKTFSNILDESFDSVTDDVERYRKTFEQIQRLASMDPAEVQEKTAGIVEHNYQQLYALRGLTRSCMINLVCREVESVLAANR
jgi:hypothetical protein